jgi:ubiquitin carboxyl-terminal hydrolase 25
MDISDALAIDAYHWQVQTDPQHLPEYLSSLKHMASARSSPDLETEVLLETSRGRFDTERLTEAYRAFQMLGPEAAVSDEDIIGAFTAQLADSPGHEHHLRDYLRIIGTHRNSKRIMDTAMNSKPDVWMVTSLN